MSLTSDRNDPELKETRPDGQMKKYFVLSAEERAKGFIRPVRHSYVHVGIKGPQFPLQDLTDEQKGWWWKDGKPGPEDFAKFEPYPPGHKGKALGRYWNQLQLDNVGKGCGVRTVMHQDIAETYARDPFQYGRTYCCGCGTHFPVGEDGEFVWDGTEERVGT